MITKPILAATAALLAAAPSGRAAITMILSDNGTNLTMTATGIYTLANASLVVGAFNLGLDATVDPTLGVFGWEVSPGRGYAATYTGSLSGTGSALGATNVLAPRPLVINRLDGTIYFRDDSPPSGNINNTAIFNNTTLASLGMVAGESMTVTWGNAGPDETLTITTVPEPSAALLCGLGSLALLRRKR